MAIQFHDSYIATLLLTCLPIFTFKSLTINMRQELLAVAGNCAPPFIKIPNFSLSLNSPNFYIEPKNIFKLFSSLGDFEHLYSYRLYSYYDKCVTGSLQIVAESHYSAMTQIPEKVQLKLAFFLKKTEMSIKGITCWVEVVYSTSCVTCRVRLRIVFPVFMLVLTYSLNKVSSCIVSPYGLLYYQMKPCEYVI